MKLKRLVFKVGTSTLYENGKLSDKIDKLVKLLSKLKRKYEIILVSSGAIGAGYTKCKIDKEKIENKQALASIGQPILIREYQKRFEKYNINIAQVLITASDFDSRKKTLYAQKMINVLINNNIIPIINENDSVSIEEIIFGDNDQLSAYVTYYFKGDILFIITDIDGFYTSNPQKNKNAKLIKIVKNIKEEWLNKPYNPNNKFATGGIVTKLKAAKFLMNKNITTVLIGNQQLENIEKYLKGGKDFHGTIFTTT